MIWGNNCRKIQLTQMDIRSTSGKLKNLMASWLNSTKHAIKKWCLTSQRDSKSTILKEKIDKFDQKALLKD